MAYYTTWGRVSGGCGHAHRTVAAAERCLAREQRWAAGLAPVPGSQRIDRGAYEVEDARAAREWRDHRDVPPGHPVGLA